eukprot:gene20438-26520_t
MFILTVIEDKIKIKPDQFDNETSETIIEIIQSKYCNKIIPDVGLVISFFDFIEVGDPYIYPSEGSSHQQVTFRLIVFRPFPGEILCGKVKDSNIDGIKVSLDFFEDIFIPQTLLNDPSTYDNDSKLWTWKYGLEDECIDFTIFIGEEIRFRVRTIHFTNVTSTAKGIAALTTSDTHIPINSKSVNESIPQRKRSTSITDLPSEAKIPVPMKVIGSIKEDGLGLISWWEE